MFELRNSLTTREGTHQDSLSIDEKGFQLKEIDRFLSFMTLFCSFYSFFSMMVINECQSIGAMHDHMQNRLNFKQRNMEGLLY
jgi:hypothetical protein